MPLPEEPVSKENGFCDLLLHSLFSNSLAKVTHAVYNTYKRMVTLELEFVIQLDWPTSADSLPCKSFNDIMHERWMTSG